MSPFVSKSHAAAAARAEEFMRKLSVKHAEMTAAAIPCLPWPEIVQRDTLTPNFVQRDERQDDYSPTKLAIKEHMSEVVTERQPPVADGPVMIQTAGKRFRAFSHMGAPLGESEHLDRLMMRFPDAVLGESALKIERRRKRGYKP